MSKYLLALLILTATGVVAGNNPITPGFDTGNTPEAAGLVATSLSDTNSPISVSVTATAVSSDTIVLDINASSTEGNITKLEIYRDGQLIDILYPGGLPPRGLHITAK